ncbi:MAG: type secretory pathway, component PulF [Patescibacteria group bacterium]|jgi:type IV pilus assembly protein PilC|nr:type secretory pathway, component PulF [Patescibacteria group bacterium]
MDSFAYKIRLPNGQVEKGSVEALNQKDALQAVHKLGGAVVELKQSGATKKVGGTKGKLSLKEKIIFTEQLSVMLTAGITLVQALKGLQEETSNKTLSSLLAGLLVDVEGGIPFSDALAKYPRIFSTIYHEMVRSAEKTGNLAEILEKLTIQQQKEYELKGKVKGALMYPAIVSILLISVIILVITFILPKLTGLFMDSGVQLPMSTKMLIALSDLFIHKYVLLLGGLALLIGGFKYMVSTKKGLFFWDGFKMKIPVLGSFLAKSYMARFCQSFSSLAQSGIPVLEIFKTLEGVVGNSVYEAEIVKISKEVENGTKVSTAIRKSKYFPSMVGQLVSVGEQSGDLAGIFKVLGEFFEKEVDSTAKNLSVILEPIIMIVMGVGVGFVLISVLQPIFSLSNSV